MSPRDDHFGKRIAYSLFLFGCLFFARTGSGEDALGELLKKYTPPAEANPPAKLVEESGKAVEAKELEVKAPSRAPASTTKAKPARIKRPPAPTPEKQPTIPEPVPPTTGSASPAVPADSPPAKETGLFGDWGGAKSGLRERGVELTLAYKFDYVSNMDGGIEKKSAFLENLDILGDFDLEKVFGAPGLSLFLYGLGNRGGDPTTFIGDSFATSSIQAPNTFKLYEAYLKPI